MDQYRREDGDEEGAAAEKPYNIVCTQPRRISAIGKQGQEDNLGTRAYYGTTARPCFSQVKPCRPCRTSPRHASTGGEGVTFTDATTAVCSAVDLHRKYVGMYARLWYINSTEWRDVRCHAGDAVRIFMRLFSRHGGRAATALDTDTF